MLIFRMKSEYVLFSEWGEGGGYFVNQGSEKEQHCPETVRGELGLLFIFAIELPNYVFYSV